jgi:hypothetical protein
VHYRCEPLHLAKKKKKKKNEDRIYTCSPRRPQIYNPPSFVSQVLGLQVCTTTPVFVLGLFNKLIKINLYEIILFW